MSATVSASSDGGASAYIGGIVGGIIGFIIMVFVIMACVIIIKTKRSTRRSRQVTVPQASVATYPSVSQQAPQLSTGGETTVTSSVPQHAACNQFYWNTGHAPVGPTVNTNGSPSDYPYPPPPYKLTYCKDEYTPDESTDNQSSRHGGVSSVPPPSYSSVVSTVPIPPSTNI